MNESTRKKEFEDSRDYLIRLFENKDMYGLTCNDIADLINTASGNNFKESTYRKYYKAFNEGRMYERDTPRNHPCTRILSISDLHIPFQLPIEKFSDYFGNIDILQINGDVIDCVSISKFAKSFRNSTMDDIIFARKYLIDLITSINPKKVICNYGNHDIRFENYLANKLGNDLVELMPRTPLELIFNDGFSHYDKNTRSKTTYEPLSSCINDVRIEYIDNWYSTMGKTIFCHPLAFRSGPMRTSEAGVQYFRNEGFDFDCLVMGHTHHIGNYLIGGTMLFEQGTCCDTKKLHYADGKLTNRQSEGCLYIEQDASGSLLSYRQIIFNKE